MPVGDCPFVLINHVPLPYLGIKIINPHTNKSTSAYGLIDTGADECAIHAGYASLLAKIFLPGKPD